MDGEETVGIFVMRHMGSRGGRGGCEEAVGVVRRQRGL